MFLTLLIVIIVRQFVGRHNMSVDKGTLQKNKWEYSSQQLNWNYKLYGCLKRWVCRCCLNLSHISALRRLSDRLFQEAEPATANAHLPSSRRVRRTNRMPCATEYPMSSVCITLLFVMESLLCVCDCRDSFMCWVTTWASVRLNAATTALHGTSGSLRGFSSSSCLYVTHLQL